MISGGGFRLLRRLLGRGQRLPPLPQGWDAHQAAVIEAAAASRLLVDGGPGTGKTAVACARVAHLVRRDGVAPGTIWVVSFTRTAVREIRDRLAAALDDSAAAEAVRVATLDSAAWALQPDPDLSGSYDEAIQRVLARVEAGGAIARSLAGLGHVILDEAHDIVGRRADLVCAIVARLAPGCGVTAFADEAQAIYGFAEGMGGGEPLPARLRDLPGFTEARLETVFRSRSPGLARIFHDTRARVLAAGTSRRILARVRRDVAALADGRVGAVTRQGLAGRDDTLVLFRRRAEVLQASARLHEAGVAHRLRLSGLAAGPAAWIAVVLADLDGAAFGRDQFLAAWHRTVAATPLAVLDSDEAWRRLGGAAASPGGLVETARLHRVLAAAQPPAGLCGAEPGWGGALLGTIHASKGREADVVHLMLAPTPRDGGEDEEARVLFVGATRARKRLLVGRAEPDRAPLRLESGRLWRPEGGRAARATVELGRDGDLDAAGLAGRRHFADAAAVRRAQARLAAAAGRLVALTARRDPGGAYALTTADDPAPLAFLSAAAGRDLDTVARALSQRRSGGPFAPPAEIGGVWLMGLATLAPPPGADLHPPWGSGALLLAPVVSGFAPVTFPSLRRG